MGAPLLTIAMPTRNRARLFERALGSVIGAGATVADDSVSGRHGDRE
jgi:hypothetical protein